MKNILSKSYITLFLLLISFATFAAEPSDGSTEGVETTDPPAPIGDHLWILALAGLILAFIWFRAIQAKKINNL